MRRIKDSIRIMNSEVISLLSLDGIASRCGFSIRITFTNVLKDTTGVAPSCFLKNQDVKKQEYGFEFIDVTFKY